MMIVHPKLSHYTNLQWKMDEFFKTIQAGSKSKKTIANYARREKKIVQWLKFECPECFDDET
jgi:hypothetical protein